LNRYYDILPYDNNIVQLEDKKYINASFLKYKNSSNKYIVTQGPLENTINDFWSMILENNINIILMLTDFIENGKTKCHTYLPLSEPIMNTQKYKIKLINIEKKDEFYIRTLNVNDKIIYHIHYLKWSDMQITTINSIYKCINIVDKYRLNKGYLRKYLSY